MQWKERIRERNTYRTTKINSNSNIINNNSYVKLKRKFI